MTGPLPDTIKARLKEHYLELSRTELERVSEYFGLLTKWNKTINLTAFDLEKLVQNLTNPPTEKQPEKSPATLEKAIDRLVAEPVVAAGAVKASLPDATALRLLDIGSGGGSPAIPLAIGLGPGLMSLHMIESKGRKAAFLRDSARQLQLPAVVHESRLEDVAANADLQAGFELVSIRAVRADRELWNAVSRLMTQAGRVLWFRSRVADLDTQEPTELAAESSRPLPGSQSELVVLKRA